MAADEYGVEIILSGSESGLREAAEKAGISLSGISIINATDVITMEDSPRDVIKTKSGSSMSVGLKALANGEGDAFVSAGNTGALVMGATFIVKTIEGIKRMALAPIMPSDKGCYMMIDGGANLECRPEMLLQFGLMGSVYMEKILHIKNPRVGLVNVGAEETKGTQLQHDAYALLKASKCNFVGNVEGRDIPAGACDVAVADGFTGNSPRAWGCLSLAALRKFSLKILPQSSRLSRLNPVCPHSRKKSTIPNTAARPLWVLQNR
jgi:glycerol-3-phosphate acyltransferase PlsX